MGRGICITNPGLPVPWTHSQYWMAWSHGNVLCDKVKPMSCGIVGIYVYKYMYTYIEIYIYICPHSETQQISNHLTILKQKAARIPVFFDAYWGIVLKVSCMYGHLLVSDTGKRRGSPVMMMKIPAFTIRCTGVCPVCLWGKYMFFDTRNLPSTQHIKHHRYVFCCGMFALSLVKMLNIFHLWWLTSSLQMRDQQQQQQQQEQRGAHTQN